MRKLLFVLVVLVLAFVYAPATFAQADVPAPSAPVFDATTIYTVAIVVFGLIIVVAFAVFGYVVRPALIQLGVSAPAFAFDGITAAYKEIMTSLGEFVASTPTALDDAAVTEIKATLDDLLKQIVELRQNPPVAPTPAPAPLPSPTDASV